MQDSEIVNRRELREAMSDISQDRFSDHVTRLRSWAEEQ